MKHILLPLLVFALALECQAQKVSLVLSGGGAKGIAHVGVLKALEENEIPIDNLVGTSMGGIIAGCYAAGMSPDEIENMVLSKQFLGWVNGESEKGYNYFYHATEKNPGFISLNLALDSTLNFQFNSSIANDVSLNFALAEKTAEASAISGNDFNRLFVPLRVVAADIFTQNEVVLSKGTLSDALRATQTVPFFYHPIRVDGKYLFDGGVYNNFPVDVAQKDFNPDVLIGVNVSTKIFDEYPYNNDDKLISKSLLFLLLDKSDPSLIPGNGVFIQPNLRGYTSFDFSRAKNLIDSGYYQTLRQMDEIKRKISRRISCDSISEKRNEFHNGNRPMLFQKLAFDGFNARQRGYIRRVFKTNRNDNSPLSFSEIKKGYFRLVSEEYFMNVYPRIQYDSTSDLFRLHLTRRPQQNFKVDFGGVIASRDISNIFLGLNYYWFNRTLSHAYLAFQTGNFYRSGIAKLRIDLPAPFYLEPSVTFDTWDYLENGDILQEVASEKAPTVLTRINRKTTLNVGVPLKHSFKATAFVEYFNNSDRYSNSNVFVSTDTLDHLLIHGIKTGFQFSSNTLNRKQYASAGRCISLSAEYFDATATLLPGNTSVRQMKTSIRSDWFRVRVKAEQYFKSGWYKPGYYFESVFSNQRSFQNYYGTIINAPAFQPLQDSRTLLLQNFRSFNFIAGGVRNVFSFSSKLEGRLEGYLFAPLDYLEPSIGQEAIVSNSFRRFFITGTAGAVYHAPIGPISLSFNYYDDDENPFGVLLHVGFLLYQNHSLE